jgi:hypothetical protein
VKRFFSERLHGLECVGRCQPEVNESVEILCVHCHHSEIVSLSCLGLTQHQTRCKRNDLNEHGFCRAHDDQAVSYSNRLRNVYMPKLEGWGGLFEKFGEAIRAEALDEIENAVRRELSLRGSSLLDMFDERSKFSEKIYFIRAGSLVKIGRSLNPQSRLKQLKVNNKQTVIPDGVDMSTAEIIAEFPGGRRVESRLHSKFARYRVAGEWFRFTKEVRQFAEKEAGDYEQSLRNMASRI